MSEYDAEAHRKYIEEMIASHPPVEPGYQRIYEDHTYRWFTDYTDAEIEAMKNDPLMKSLQEEITKEINREIIEKLLGLEVLDQYKFKLLGKKD